PRGAGTARPRSVVSCPDTHSRLDTTPARVVASGAPRRHHRPTPASRKTSQNRDVAGLSPNGAGGAGGSAPQKTLQPHELPMGPGVGGGRRGLPDGPLQTQGPQPIQPGEIAFRPPPRPPVEHSDSPRLDEPPPLTSEPLPARP